MGRRGPHPKPASVKTAQGNPGRRPIGNDPVATGDTDAPAAVAHAAARVMPPDWLKAEGLKVWERLAPRLVALKLLSQADATTFARYCRNFARWLKMQKLVDKEGETYESVSAHGNLKRVNPAFLIADRIEKSLFAFEDRFGLNPAERQRIFAQRAAAGAQGSMFDAPPTQPHQNGTEPTAEQKESQAKSAVGFLN